jgi:hypothetical protein
MKTKILTSSILLLMAATMMFASDEEFARANELYQQENYQEALDIYQQIHASGIKNEKLEYNIASCYYRLGQAGLARLHFEKALLLAPGDEDTRYNIEFIEKRFLKKTLRQENFVSMDRFLWNLVTAFPPVITLWTGIIAFIIIFLLVTVKMVVPKLLPPALRWTVTIVLAIVVVISFSISFTREMLLNDHSYGIIVKAGVGVLSSPAADAHSRFPAPEAIKVRIARTQAEWVEIVLPNGSKGWVQESELGII